MWPFTGGETGELIKNDFSSHDAVSYSIDGAFIVLLVVAILSYRWRRNANRLRQLEHNVRQRELSGISSV